MTRPFRWLPRAALCFGLGWVFVAIGTPPSLLAIVTAGLSLLAIVTAGLRPPPVIAGKAWWRLWRHLRWIDSRGRVTAAGRRRGL